MAGQENLDHDLRDFQPPKEKAKTTCESGARFKCLTCDEEMLCASEHSTEQSLDDVGVFGVEGTVK